MFKSIVFLFSLLVALATSFTIQAPNPSSLALMASRRAQKKASRTKWLEKRGFGGVDTVAQGEETSEEEEEPRDDSGEEEEEEEASASEE
eukprot:CAMPEP_0202451586 /NCGR_PEP_ID=MMETSP1360-20130828/9989_1 /ASSEMBLY_ACC=CAM_ASM_000848 /TAXON_ID=515479 /ORGANISM="Licmophora paradoxa, Strain CCMP2313" /LENGTH=89 /DNA_ID=CAMNT_0049070189 /DNA_START=144 /DNA_END=413 /DNA_ORIENTATION=+